jgi:hypothetical protein
MQRSTRSKADEQNRMRLCLANSAAFGLVALTIASTAREPQWCTACRIKGMGNRAKLSSSRSETRAVRQSVSIPAPLVREVRRVAKERHLTISRALVTLAERGVRAELDAKENLKAAYRTFLKEQNSSKKEEAGRDMIRAIFGRHAIAEDPFL